MTTSGRLKIAGTGGWNHFDVQVARTGDTDPLYKSQADIEGGYDETPYFTDTGTAVQFYARADAPKTSAGAAGARCELREVNPDGSDMGFDPFDGNTHYIKGKSKITAHPTDTTANIGVVVAQLHNGTTDRLAFRTQMVSSSLRLRFRVNGSSVNGTSSGSPEIVTAGAGNIVGVEFDWEIRVYGGNGTTCTVDFYINGAVWHTSTALVSTGSASWYFKTGCYNNFEAADVGATDFAQVELRSLEHWHTGWATVAAPFPTVVSTATSQVSSTNFSPTMPASIVAGRLLVVVASADNASLSNPTASGWTRKALASRSSGSATIVVFAKVAAGSDTCTISGFGTPAWTGHAYQVANWSGTLSEVTAAATAGAITTLDPPNLSAGSTKNWLWIAACGNSNDITTIPTNYTDGLENNQSSQGWLASARRELNASSENPGVFGGTQSVPCVATIAIPPAVPPAGNTSGGAFLQFFT